MITKNTTVKPFDAHAHALLENVTHPVCLAGDDPDTWEDIAQKKHLAFAIGFGQHPWFAHKKTAFPHLIHLLKLYPYSFVGEIGLDRSKRYKASLSFQTALFEEQLKIARDFQRPVAIHLVRASALGYEFIHKFYGPEVYLHGYICSIEESKRYPKAFFGIHDRMITNIRVQQLIQSLSIQQILVESDGVSDIRYIEKTIEQIANIKKIAAHIVCEQLYQNTLRWLRIG